MNTTLPLACLHVALSFFLFACTPEDVPPDPMLSVTSAVLTPNGTGSNYAEFTVTEPVPWVSICAVADGEVSILGLIAHNEQGSASVLFLSAALDDGCITPDMLNEPHPDFLPGMRYTVAAEIVGDGTAEIWSECSECVQWLPVANLIACEEMPGQITSYDSDGVSKGVSIVLAARLGPTLPRQMLGCFVRPSGYGAVLCEDADPGMTCAITTTAVPLSSCEVAREIFYTGQEFIAVCGTMTDVDGIDDHIVVNIRYTSMLVTY